MKEDTVFRTRSWNHEVARQLHSDPRYAKLFVQKLIRDGEDPEEVIRTVVRAYGLKELAEKVHIRPQNLARVLRAPAKAKDETLNRIVRPFGVKVSRRLAFTAGPEAGSRKPLDKEESRAVQRSRRARAAGARTLTVAQARKRLLS
jgi:DNA-binding phage protein